MKTVLLIIVMLHLSIGVFSQSNDTRQQLDTIPAIEIERIKQDSLAIIDYKIIESFKVGQDSILIYNDIDGIVKLIVFRDELIETTEIGIKYNEAEKMNLYSAAKDITYKASIDSLGTFTPYLILNWTSKGVWTSSLCFGNSGMTTNEETKTQRGITIIDLKNSMIVFSGLTGYSTSNTNIREGGFGGSCTRIALNLEENLLSIKHIVSGSQSQPQREIVVIGAGYQCPANNTLHLYDFEIKENANYKLKNGLFVKIE